MDKPLGKPTGITLEDHTAGVVREAKYLLGTRPFMREKYARLTGKSLKKSLIRAARWHDLGKAHDIWQTACRRDYEAYQETREMGGHLLTADFRHEMDSVRRARRSESVNLSFEEEAAILAHHRKLSDRHEHRWFNREDPERDFSELWTNMKRESGFAEDDLDKLPTSAVLQRRYQIAAIRSLLQLADVRASRIEEDEPVPEFEEFDYTFPHRDEEGNPSYREVQQIAIENRFNQRFILRAPTGTGKTDAALLWAKYQIEAGHADRVVFAMPTRFTSNALEIGISEDLGSTGVYHSSAWHAKHQSRVTSGEVSMSEAREQHLMERLLMPSASVTTIDHLLASLTGMREDHHGIFFNMTNACVVIDEADFYDSFVQANIEVLLQVLDQFDVPVLIMSATVPESAMELYSVSSIEDSTSTESKCTVHAGTSADEPEDAADILQHVVRADTAIVYANTVKRAIRYYDWLREHGRRPILYHSRFTEPDKSRIETRLIESLGSDAWESGSAAGIAVLTQIGEMSLNISSPLMVSELCPFDRLAQREGRLSRFPGMPPGDLHVITPTQDGELYPAPYGEYLMGPRAWRPTEAFLETQNRIRSKSYSPADFVEEVNHLYQSPEVFSPRARRNQERLDELMRNHWLIVPDRANDEDEREEAEWRTRDIPPQRPVFIEHPPASFESWGEYRHFERIKSVESPVWEVAASEITEVASFHIQDDEETVAYCEEYSPEVGLILR